MPDGRADLSTLAARIETTTAARGVDVFAVDDCGYSILEWARATGRNRKTVRLNVERARSDYNDTGTDDNE